MKYIIIKKGIKVLSEKKGLIELLDDVCISAFRQHDGGFKYSINNNNYYVSAGNCRFIK